VGRSCDLQNAIALHGLREFYQVRSNTEGIITTSFDHAVKFKGNGEST
jgi:hypothetical protein